MQDTWLNSGTIRDNIDYGRMNATDEVEGSGRAAHEPLSGLFRMVMKWKLTKMLPISAGQKRLLTMARAFQRVPVLILDEATSASFDTRTERQIQQAMEELMCGRTSFIIVHRLSVKMRTASS